MKYRHWIAAMLVFGLIFGLSGIALALEMSADFDGDGIADKVVWRPSNETWYVKCSGGSTANCPGGTMIVPWGAAGDIPVAEDFTGDGRADFGIFRPSDGNWYIKRSSDMAFIGLENWGTSGDIPLPGWSNYIYESKTGYILDIKNTKDHGIQAEGVIGIHGKSPDSATSGSAIIGHAYATSGQTNGVYGINDSTSGKGVYGRASASSGVNNGVYGETASTSGNGVYGYAPASNLNTAGVYGYGYGFGLYGYSSASSGASYGVYGYTGSTEGYGVYGYSGALTGVNYGVRGVNNSASGYAIYGVNYNASGKAGYFSGDVTVTGALSKGSGTFVQPHAKDPSKEIQYAFFEGPEHAVFLRGTAKLKDGKAVIELPEHFRVVAAEEGIQVQLTSRSADTYGLAVTEQSRDRIVVKEFKDGKGNFEFNYFITAMRAGFEDHQPIAANTHFKPTENETAKEFEDRYTRDDITTKAMRSMLISNGILSEEGKLNMVKVKELGWAVAEESKNPRPELKAETNLVSKY